MNKYLLITALLVASLSVLAYNPIVAQSTARTHRRITAHGASRHSSARQQVLEMERAGREASLRNDVGFFERTLAPDYFGIGPAGNRVTKEEAIAERKSGRLRWQSIVPSDEYVRVLGPAAVATGIWSVRGTLDDHDISGRVRYTRIWQKVDGRWILVHNQITSITAGASH